MASHDSAAAGERETIIGDRRGGRRRRRMQRDHVIFMTSELHYSNHLSSLDPQSLGKSDNKRKNPAPNLCLSSSSSVLIGTTRPPPPLMMMDLFSVVVV